MKFFLLTLAGLLLAVAAPAQPRAAALLVAAAATPATSSATAYTADVTASRLRWTGHAAVGSYAPTGTIALQAATLTLGTDGRTPRAARVVVAMPTLAADNADLGAHLRNADFFDVARFPTATFELTSFRADSARGHLTIKGVTRAVRIPATLTPTATGALLRGTATVDRTAFGVVYNSPNFFADLGDQAIGNRFELEFEVVLKRR